jgi:hypothetical protein
MILVQQIVFDQAVLHPELIEARWKCGSCVLTPWNPLSDEYDNFYQSHKFKLTHAKKNISEIPANASETGYLKALTPLYINGYLPYYPGQYKYTLVLTGIH